MEMQGLPKPGDILNRSTDKPYQVVAIATNAETGETMIVYQALFGDFTTYVGTPEAFMQVLSGQELIPTLHSRQSEVKQKAVQQTVSNDKNISANINEGIISDPNNPKVNTPEDNISEEAGNNDNVDTIDGAVSSILLKFLDAESYHKKLEVISSNRKHLTDRLINDMAVALDCAVDDGPMEDRIRGLINCLQTMSRFENRRLR